jgi:hypothetical protein
MLMNMARGVKDGALAMALKAYVNDRLGAYGEVTDCSIDTRAGKLTVKALLKGERDKVTATIERYALEAEGADRYIVLQKFSTSRDWLTLLLTKFFTGKRYKLPAAVSALL